MTRKPLALVLLLGGAAAVLLAEPIERAMFGGSFARNMVSDETGLPADWDVKTGRNVKWWADVGSQDYAGPVVAGGKVFVGTNNDGLRVPEEPDDLFQAAPGQEDPGGRLPAARDDPRLVEGGQPHGLGPVILRILKGRQSSQPAQRGGRQSFFF